jgi:glycosyltransferase involved in cell wall biosynthesis
MRVSFIMEQHLGHRSYYQNLRHFIDENSQIEATWTQVTYAKQNTLLGRLPGLPAYLRGSFAGRAQVRNALQELPYDIAVFNTQVPAALAGDLVRQKPYVLCTDITPIQYDALGDQYQHRADRLGWIRRYKYKVNLRLMHEAARILPWSTWTKDSLVMDYLVDPKRIEVLPPGLDLTLWRPGQRKEGKLVRVLFVGGEFNRKGGDLLLKAVKHLPKGLLEIVLVTRSPVEPQDGVTIYDKMQPNSPDLVQLYQSCDIFALPSRAEAFGIAAVEASATGLPVVATATGGLEEIVDNRKTGFIVPVDDVHALATSLQCLAENTDLRRALGRAARQRAEVKFDARKNAARLVDILFEANR